VNSKASSSAERAKRSGFFGAAVFAAVVAAMLLRIASARGELWLDEIWTIQGVQAAHSPADIVLSLKHDNNHFLNSFVAYMIGPDGAAWMYRCPAVIAGALTVLLAGWIQRGRGSVAVLSALVLTGFSFLLVDYSSEARGYAYEMLFALATFGILCQAEEAPSVGWDCAFAVTCSLGFLAHPLFLNVYLAAQVWTWFAFRRRQPEQRAAPLAARILFRTIIPGLFFGWLYWVNWSQMSIGGGESLPIFDVVVQTLSLAIGGPFEGPAALLAAVVTILCAGAALWNVFWRAPQRAAFYLCSTFVFPAVILALAPREDIYPRYFLISVLFLLMLWSDFLGDLCRSFVAGKLWTAAALAAFIVANGWHVSQLLIDGRGHYQQALQTIEQQTQGNRAVVLVDHPNRQEAMLDFFARRMPLAKPIEVLPPTSENSASAEWFLTQNLNANFVPTETITAPGGVAFRLVRHYPFAGLSGWHLCLYQREPAAK
jgi:hypothetical protein